jgi:hypothetical protein
MRRVLVILLILASSVLLLQAPAFAFHRFYSVDLISIGGSGTFSVTTDCPAGSQFVLKSAVFNVAPAADRGSVKLKVPSAGKIARKTAGSDKTAGHDIFKFQFTTEKLSSRAHGSATFTATCKGHPLRVGEPYSNPKAEQTLALTGVPALLLFALGLGLVLTGGAFLAIGRSTGSGPGRP